MKTIYALLVGINDYPAPVRRLEGCVNDIQEIETYLQARVEVPGQTQQESLSIKTLLDGEATREAIIEAFQNHLGQATADDVALFYFSGHGSQQQSPEEFWHLEPDHLDETLVCYDSRSEENWDLADKEIAQLIREVATGGAHVLVVLDCCHSGSGTRHPISAETAVRRAPTDLRKRPLASFLLSAEDVPAVALSRNLIRQPSGWNFQGQYVLLAACRAHEEAREYVAPQGIRGAFSYFLVETLGSIDGKITYRDLFERAAALVRSQVRWQTPQLEAPVAADLSRPFLGGAIRSAGRFLIVTHERGRWLIDAGRVDGLPAATPEDPAEVALFELSASDEVLADPRQAIGQARITHVFGASSQIEIIQGNITPDSAPLKAVLTLMPTPQLKVRLRGNSDAVAVARSALADSLFVREVEEGELADYVLLAQDQQYVIAKPEDDRPLVKPIDHLTPQSAQRVVARLEHLERWKTTAELHNPHSSIRSDEVQVEILQDGQPLTGPDIRLHYVNNGWAWQSPELTIRLTNSGPRTLYVGLLNVTQTFGIFSLLMSVGSQRLGPGEQAFANDGQPVIVEVPDSLWQQGINETKDLIKVIVSTSSFDARRLEQPDLDMPHARASSERSAVQPSEERLGTLERLMERVQTRRLVLVGSSRIDDWRTFQFSLTTVRPLPAEPLRRGSGVTLAEGVTLEPHPALEVAEVRVETASQATRNVLAAGPALPRWLYDDSQVVRPLDFAPTRTASRSLNVLELRGLNDPRLVTADAPLEVRISNSLAPGEFVLPLACDGEFYLPLGWGESDGLQTRVVLQRLPHPEPEATRSLGGALRIFFHKVIGRILGASEVGSILAVAEIDEHFEVHYETDLRQVRQRVQQAECIALFVHGIIGETRSMVPSLRRAKVADHYDLVLTFDYENLHEPIENTALALKGRLEEVGLVPGAGKQLDVIAHSMGGLVSRWFIEHEGGDQLVSRLVMLGTPNGGSPWPGVVDWATTALAVGLNELSWIGWPASVLSGLVQATHWVQVTLHQMQPDSAFLRQLHASSHPRIPYTLIAGNTSLIERGVSREHHEFLLRRLLRRLWPQQRQYELADLFFAGADNDIAVSLESMQRVPRSHEPPWDIREVPCDHLSYFRTQAALTALGESLC